MIKCVPLEPPAQPAPPDVDEHLVTLLQRSSPEVDQYNALRYTLEERRVADAQHVLAITSPAVGDGKTTTAINLSGALAHRRDARVLLIDADLRRPAVSALLRLPQGAQPGLAGLIADERMPLERAILALPAFNLSVLPAGRLSDDPFELLRAPRLGELLQEARRRYDFVVLDTPPLVLVPDSRVLENWVDAFLLIVAANRTPRKLVSEALNLLNPSKVLGLVFNGAARPASGYYGYDSYEYIPSHPESKTRRVR